MPDLAPWKTLLSVWLVLIWWPDILRTSLASQLTSSSSPRVLSVSGHPNLTEARSSSNPKRTKYYFADTETTIHARVGEKAEIACFVHGIDLANVVVSLLSFYWNNVFQSPGWQRFTKLKASNKKNASVTMNIYAMHEAHNSYQKGRRKEKALFQYIC